MIKCQPLLEYLLKGAAIYSTEIRTGITNITQIRHKKSNQREEIMNSKNSGISHPKSGLKIGLTALNKEYPEGLLSKGGLLTIGPSNKTSDSGWGSIIRNH